MKELFQNYWVFTLQGIICFNFKATRHLEQCLWWMSHQTCSLQFKVLLIILLSLLMSNPFTFRHLTKVLTHSCLTKPVHSFKIKRGIVLFGILLSHISILSTVVHYPLLQLFWTIVIPPLLMLSNMQIVCFQETSYSMIWASLTAQ